MTAEVDQNSSINKGKGDNHVTVDLFREFKWTTNAASGSFEQVAFPGIFPDLTRYQAETDQQMVENGQDQWKNDAVKTAQAMAAKLLNWTANASSNVLSGGGSGDIDATIRLVSPYPGGRAIKVTLSRLEGVDGNIWEVIGVTSGDLTVISPMSLETLVSPITMGGTGSAFEGVVGQAFVFDHLYTAIGQNKVTAGGMGQTTYTSSVTYNASFQGVQEGLIAIYAYSQTDNSVASAVIQKELLSSDDHTIQKTLAC